MALDPGRLAELDRCALEPQHFGTRHASGCARAARGTGHATFVYEVVEPTTPSTTAIDYLLGAFAVVGTVATAAIVLGLVLAGTLIAVRRARGTALTGAGSASTRLDLGARLDPRGRRGSAPVVHRGPGRGGPLEVCASAPYDRL